MKAIRIAVLAAALAIAAPALAGSRAPVGEPVAIQFAPSDGSIESVDALRAAIVEAAERKTWHVVEDKPGVLRLAIKVRQKHDVVIDVAYDTKGATLAYVSSENMDYKVKKGVPLIHSSYTRWVSLLGQDIVDESRKL